MPGISSRSFSMVFSMAFRQIGPTTCSSTHSKQASERTTGSPAASLTALGSYPPNDALSRHAGRLFRHAKVLQKRLIACLGRRISRNQLGRLPHKWIPTLLLRLRVEVMVLGVNKNPFAT